MKTTKFSARRKILASVAMLAVSAVMLSSATYAWFTINKTVSVTGMKLKATAEQGLVISGDDKATWLTAWDVNMSAGVALAPASTDGAATPAWVTAGSRAFDNADKDNPITGYTNLSLTYAAPASITGNAFGNGEGVGSANDHDYVLKKIFYIKSASNEAWTGQNLVIDSVTAELPSTAATANLDKSLRVLVVVGSDSFIYAPVAGYDTSCKFRGTTALTLIASDTDSTCTSVTSIPANNTTSPIEVDMYIYFEGEDQNCKSSNLTAASVDELTVSASFKTAASA